MAEPFIAQISLFGGNFAPRGWAFCDGQLLSIAQNSALFSLLGTTYGGDGRTTFGLPDLRGRVPVGPRNGPGLSPYRLGQKGGSESKTLTVNNLPAHNHEIPVSNAAADKATPQGNYLANGEVYAAAPTAQAFARPVATTGGSQAFDIRQPSLAINYIIALTGIFPSRS